VNYEESRKNIATYALGGKGMAYRRKIRKNELDMFFLVAKKAINKLIEESPKGGLLVDKGTPEEGRLKYTEALKVIKKMESLFATRGALSFGICKDCTRFDLTAHNSIYDCFGDCKLTKKEVHAYDSCDKCTGDMYGI
jgi:hypothetical protein